MTKRSFRRAPLDRYFIFGPDWEAPDAESPAAHVVVVYCLGRRVAAVRDAGPEWNPDRLAAPASGTVGDSLPGPQDNRVPTLFPLIGRQGARVTDQPWHVLCRHHPDGHDLDREELTRLLQQSERRGRKIATDVSRVSQIDR